ncbi:MAG: SRPBCC domain-containing protein [Actinomycetota bacterium]|nr:SRPBCC domain-containing protein [Actinomycetota bacterium]
MTKPIMRARLDAPLARVRHALTDAEELSVWFAEHAEVELPATYTFWGRYTPEGAEPHQRLLHADDTTLRFTWTLDGIDTVVEITLAEETADTTLIAVSQSDIPSWEEMVAEANIRAVLYTFWALAIANLSDHVTGRSLNPLCDFTSSEMRARVVIAATPAEVFAALTTPESFGQWFGANIEIEPWVGGRFAMGGVDIDSQPATIIEFEQDARVAMSWEDTGATSWELDGSEGATRLTIVHSGFDTVNPPYGAWMGWLSGVAELRRFVELSEWRSIWLEVSLDGIPEGMLTIDHS